MTREPRLQSEPAHLGRFGGGPPLDNPTDLRRAVSILAAVAMAEIEHSEPQMMMPAPALFAGNRMPLRRHYRRGPICRGAGARAGTLLPFMQRAV